MVIEDEFSAMMEEEFEGEDFDCVECGTPYKTEEGADNCCGGGNKR